MNTSKTISKLRSSDEFKNLAKVISPELARDIQHIFDEIKYIEFLMPKPNKDESELLSERVREMIDSHYTLERYFVAVGKILDQKDS